MANELSPESETIIRDLLSRGVYPDRTAVLDEAIQLLGCRHRELKALIQEGIDSGPSIPGEVVFTRLRSRAAEIERRAAQTR